MKYEIEEELCGGTVYKVLISDKASQLVDYFAISIEKRRLDLPLASYSAVLGAVADMLSELQIVIDEEDSKAADVFAESRQEVKSMVDFLKARRGFRFRRRRFKAPSSMIMDTRKDLLRKNEVGVMIARAGK
jgi:hypothetical protein